MNTDPTIAKVNTLLLLRRSADARAIALAGLGVSPSPAILAALVSQSFELENRLPDAVEWANKALEMGPECAFAYFQCARVDIRLARYASARDKVNRAIGLEHCSSYLGLSSILHSIDREPERALEQARSGLQINGDCWICQLAEYQAECELGSHSDKKDRALALLSRHPESAEMLFSIGFSLALSDLPKGREMLAAALALRPESDAFRAYYLASLVAPSAGLFKWFCNGDVGWTTPTRLTTPVVLSLLAQTGLLWSPPVVGAWAAVCAFFTVVHVSFAATRLQVFTAILLRGQSRLLREQERMLAKLTLGLCCIVSLLALGVCYRAEPWIAAWGLMVFSGVVPLSAVGRHPIRPSGIPWTTLVVFLGLGSLSVGLRGLNLAPNEVVCALWLGALIAFFTGHRLLEPEMSASIPGPPLSTKR